MPRIPTQPKWPEITWICATPEKSVPASASRPRVLGINPWAYDFAAYNLWSRPLGLIAALQALWQSGSDVALLDCMDRTWRDVGWPQPERYGCGRYPRTEIPPPASLRHIPRRFCRYGLPYEAVSGALARMDPPPDLVLVTCVMTYWYPGAVAAARLARSIWPDTPIVLGGAYASLCSDHAANTAPVDEILTGPAEEPGNWSRIWKLLGEETPPSASVPDAGALISSLYPGADFSVLLGSRGCPFSCAYCSSDLLYPGFTPGSWERLMDQVRREHAKGVRDFAFYDDALLVRPEDWLIPFLHALIQSGLRIRLHTPNGLHAAYLRFDVCLLLAQAGLTTVRLGLETSRFDNRPDAKLSLEAWDTGVGNLLRAGFYPENVGAYILFGLPDQEEEEVRRAVSFAKSYGLRPHLTYYSPIPGTEMFPRAERASPYPLRADPLYQNRAIWPCYPGGFNWRERNRWMEILRQVPTPMRGREHEW